MTSTNQGDRPKSISQHYITQHIQYLSLATFIVLLLVVLSCCCQAPLDHIGQSHRRRNDHVGSRYLYFVFFESAQFWCRPLFTPVCLWYVSTGLLHAIQVAVSSGLVHYFTKWQTAPLDTDHLGVYRCQLPLMSTAHTSPSLSLTLQWGDWSNEIQDSQTFDEKVNASFIFLTRCQNRKVGKESG